MDTGSGTGTYGTDLTAMASVCFILISKTGFWTFKLILFHPDVVCVLLLLLLTRYKLFPFYNEENVFFFTVYLCPYI
jgi:hypothetical protein